MNLSIVGTIPNLVIDADVSNVKISTLNIVKLGSTIELLHNPGIQQMLGIIDHKEAFSVPCFYINIIDFNQNEKIADVLSSMRGIFEKLLFSFWLVKDNSIHSNLIFGVNNNGISINRSPRTFTNAEGNYAKNEFSLDEIKIAEDWFKLLPKKASKSKGEKGKSVIGNLTTHTEKNLYLETRLDRAIRFILEARSQSYLLAKITYYISALEALLSNTNSELRMQVADRSARILGESIEEKLKINKTVSSSYDFRSTFIHGDSRTEKSVRKTLKPYNSIEELLVELDDILRRLLRKFLTDMNHIIHFDKTEFGKWANELLYT